MHSKNKHIYCILLISYYFYTYIYIYAFHNTLVLHNMNLSYNSKVVSRHPYYIIATYGCKLYEAFVAFS